MPGEAEDFDFDVAVSFAGEDRNYVATVVEKLKESQVSVFYDQDFTSEMWGENLADYLQDVYRRRARYAVIFISRHYLAKMWTRHERQSAQDRALNQPSPYILPVRLDDSEVPGLHSTVGHLDARTVGADEIVSALMRKLGAVRLPATPRFNGNVPRTSEEMAVLLAERPGCWEYLLFAAVLNQELNTHEDKYRDHLLRYSPRSGRYLGDDEAVEALERNSSFFLGLSSSFERVLDPRAQDAAFGLPGEPGDPDRIIHLARRIISVYEEFMDLAAEVRATAVSSESLRRVMDIEASWADQPVEQIRNFVGRFVSEIGAIVERVNRGERVVIDMVIKLEIGDELVRQHSLALKAYGRERRRAKK